MMKAITMYVFSTIVIVKKFSSFQVNLLKRKKTITDIKFLEEKDVKDDVLAWNCINVNKYSKSE